MNIMRTAWHGTVVAGGLLLLATTGSAWSSNVSNCTEKTCTWEISVGGDTVEQGTYQTDENGNIEFDGTGPIRGDGYEVGIESLSGNIDPVLGFGLGASNTSGGLLNFAFAFSLPLGGLSPPIISSSELGTTLTAFGPEGGSVFPTLGGGKIVDSQDISLEPFSNVDKGVDVGDGLSINRMGTVVNVESESGSILGGGPYDLMSITVAFGLTDQTGVGFSGFVEQVPSEIPVPAAIWLFITGLVGLLATARRSVLR